MGDANNGTANAGDLVCKKCQQPKSPYYDLCAPCAEERWFKRQQDIAGLAQLRADLATSQATVGRMREDVSAALREMQGHDCRGSHTVRALLNRALSPQANTDSAGSVSDPASTVSAASPQPECSKCGDRGGKTFVAGILAPTEVRYPQVPCPGCGRVAGTRFRAPQASPTSTPVNNPPAAPAGMEPGRRCTRFLHGYKGDDKHFWSQERESNWQDARNGFSPANLRCPYIAPSAPPVQGKACEDWCGTDTGNRFKKGPVPDGMCCNGMARGFGHRCFCSALCLVHGSPINPAIQGKARP